MLFVSLHLSICVYICKALLLIHKSITTDTADSSDHVVAANAIAAGLAEGHTAAKPGYWLHLGGTGILTFADTDRGVYGEYSDKVYDDWDGVDELTHLPDHAFHRNVDAIVLEAGTKNADKVKTALLCPPTIYGKLPHPPPLSFDLSIRVI